MEYDGKGNLPVDLSDLSPRTALAVELYGWNSKANQSGKQALVQMTELLERHILDDGW